MKIVGDIVTLEPGDRMVSLFDELAHMHFPQDYLDADSYAKLRTFVNVPSQRVKIDLKPCYESGERLPVMAGICACGQGFFRIGHR